MVAHMERWEIEHHIAYSYFLEKMYATATDRIDKFLNSLLILSGTAVFAGIAGSKYFGAFVAVLSTISFVYGFGKASCGANDQAKAYHELLINRKQYDSDIELLMAFKRINRNDVRPWLCFSIAARKRAQIFLHGKTLDSPPKKYTKYQCVMSLLGGDKPK